MSLGCDVTRRFDAHRAWETRRGSTPGRIIHGGENPFRFQIILMDTFESSKLRNGIRLRLTSPSERIEADEANGSKWRKIFWVRDVFFSFSAFDDGIHLVAWFIVFIGKWPWWSGEIFILTGQIKGGREINKIRRIKVKWRNALKKRTIVSFIIAAEGGRQNFPFDFRLSISNRLGNRFVFMQMSTHRPLFQSPFSFRNFTVEYFHEHRLAKKGWRRWRRCSR